MMNRDIDLPDEISSERLAARLASCLHPGLVLAFCGEIGTGKTTFIRAMLRALGVQGPIKSPTFSLVESYPWQSLQIHHFDLYRIHNEEELEYIGFRDYFGAGDICCIEWPERAKASLSAVDLGFSLSVKGSGRFMSIEAIGTAGETILTCLTGNK